jgi:oxalate decarboxylase
VKEGDLWYFPAGIPHSLQGLGPDGAEFILAFDNGAQSEFNTLLVTDWAPIRHRMFSPRTLACLLRPSARIFTHNLWIFQSPIPAYSLPTRMRSRADRTSAKSVHIFAR